MARIRSIKTRPILDSRGDWTIEVALTLQGGKRVVASVPQGKSTGTHEVATVPAGTAARIARKVISPKLRGKNVLHQRDIDAALIRLDETSNKRRLGGNTMLGVSIACARAAALAGNMPLWKHIRNLSGLTVREVRKGTIYPRLYMNVVNGGLHAGNNLDFQEYLVIPKARTFRESVVIGTSIYRALGDHLSRTKGAGARNVGDEGGYAPNFKNNLEPFHIAKRIIGSLRLQGRVDFGLDAAATGMRMKREALSTLYRNLARSVRLLYLEDPFSEEEFLKFADLRRVLGPDVLVAGDDLTTTNVSRMEMAHAEGSVNAVIVKPNQVGTVSEALDAVRAARNYGWAVVASHRSGETNDDFIADFAYGVGADGLKLGAPARGERAAKYNRLLQIEKASY